MPESARTALIRIKTTQQLPWNRNKMMDTEPVERSRIALLRPNVHRKDHAVKARNKCETRLRRRGLVDQP